MPNMDISSNKPTFSQIHQTLTATEDTNNTHAVRLRSDGRSLYVRENTMSALDKLGGTIKDIFVGRSRRQNGLNQVKQAINREYGPGKAEAALAAIGRQGIRSLNIQDLNALQVHLESTKIADAKASVRELANNPSTKGLANLMARHLNIPIETVATDDEDTLKSIKDWYPRGVGFGQLGARAHNALVTELDTLFRKDNNLDRSLNIIVDQFRNQETKAAFIQAFGDFVNHEGVYSPAVKTASAFADRSIRILQAQNKLEIQQVPKGLLDDAQWQYAKDNLNHVTPTSRELKGNFENRDSKITFFQEAKFSEIKKAFALLGSNQSFRDSGFDPAASLATRQKTWATVKEDVTRLLSLEPPKSEVIKSDPTDAVWTQIQRKWMEDPGSLVAQR